jgi:large subunit ribosomal protein L25
MANIIDVSATLRTAVGSGPVNRLRKAGSIPAVVYGKGKDNQNIQVETKTFTKVIFGSASDNILVNLQIDGVQQLALVQEVQHDHLKGGIAHVDFHAIKDDEEIHAAVPVVLVGEAAGAKFGGMLELLLHSVEVRCLPKDLPEKITADVSHLNVGDSIHISDLKLAEGVRAKLDGNVVVAMVEKPKVEEVAATPAADAKADPKAKGAPAAKAAAPAAKAAAPAAKK